MKIIRKILLIVFLLILLIYVTNITAIPKNIILFKGEELNLATIFGIYIKEETPEPQAIQTSILASNINTIETKTIHLSLFNIMEIKDIEVNIIPTTTVIPLGNSVGLKLYTSGVLVVGMTEVEGQKPYESTGIEEGDMIVEVNQEEVTNTDELINTVNNSEGENVNIKYIRNGIEYVSNIEPIKTEANEYKLGLWVRDGAAGIGTISYYEPQTKKFAALGHGITDIDTEELINISSGELVTSKIMSIVKGKEGIPRRNKRKYSKWTRNRKCGDKYSIWNLWKYNRYFSIKY
ncbi:MAG: SpoIVB peptidase S55 domain-containing protein [Clostridia bacterium]|nr:SpoIVB peptidase S55 domain-containing protein [Clostridia bacterium]